MRLLILSLSKDEWAARHWPFSAACQRRSGHLATGQDKSLSCVSGHVIDGRPRRVAISASEMTAQHMPISTTESATRIRNVIASLDGSETGLFLNNDGSRLDW